jgi:uncharacterized protein (TIGR03000 family)
MGVSHFGGARIGSPFGGSTFHGSRSTPFFGVNTFHGTRSTPFFGVNAFSGNRVVTTPGATPLRGTTPLVGNRFATPFFGVNAFSGSRFGTPFFGVNAFSRGRFGVPVGTTPFGRNLFARERFDRHHEHFRHDRFGLGHHNWWGSQFGPYGWGSGGGGGGGGGGGFSPYATPYDFSATFADPAAALVYNSGYDDAASYPGLDYATAGLDYSSYYPPGAAKSPDTAAHVTIEVPPDAQLLVNGKSTPATGPIRYMDSPALTPGVAYQYLIEARWIQDGHPVAQSQMVGVFAGTNIRVTFPMPSENGAR